MVISDCASRKITFETYRCQEQQCLLEVAEIGNKFRANPTRNVFDEGMKFFQGRLVKDRLDDKPFDVLHGVFAEVVAFFVVSGAC
jgi:hypothetical protein